jgi:putative FmdB family regulatory protein
MPIFEYVCKQCKGRFEALVRSSAAVACPSCKSTSLEKQVSVSAKGRGVYAKGRSGDLNTSPVSESDYAAACAAVGDTRGPGLGSLDD